MADERMLTKAELEASKGATGRIVRIVGPVVDVEFPADQLPAIYNALTVDAKTPAGEMHVVLEVETPTRAFCRRWQVSQHARQRAFRTAISLRCRGLLRKN